MTFPAWFDLMRDPAILAKPAAQRVYAKLLENPRIFYDPMDVKAWLLAEQMGMARDTVNDALDALIRLGYLCDHGRGQNNVRRVTMIVTRPATEKVG